MEYFLLYVNMIIVYLLNLLNFGELFRRCWLLQN